MDYIKRAKNFKTKKRLGQNFLTDEEILDKIASYVNNDDYIVEIGPGIGFVTEKIVKKAKKLWAVELDEDAIRVLKKIDELNLEIIHQDILKTQICDLTDQKVKIIANIPYYITSPILAHLLGEIDEITHKNRNQIDSIILMVQYEVAKRIVASPGGSSPKEYGMLTFLSQFYSDPKIIQKVSRKSFYPSPAVDSALLELKVRQTPIVESSDYKFLKRVIKASFATRRKNIRNSLLNGGFSKDCIDKTLLKLSISPDTRGETLSIQQFENLSKELKCNQ